MDAFGYLSVLLSIILGLAITEILQGYRLILLRRRHIKLAAAPLIWSGLLLLFAAQGWWASFGLANHRDWSFFAFAIVLLQFGLLYMLAAVILPELDEGEIDLGQHFDDHRRAFFGFIIAMLVTSVVKDVVLDHELPEAENLGFHLLFVATSVAGILISSRRAQAMLATTAVIGAIAYIAILFATLGQN